MATKAKAQPDPQRYNLVKHVKTGIALHRIVKRNGGEDLLKLESKMEPAGSFDSALQKLEGALRQYCELPAEYADERITVQSVHFHPKDGSIQITGYVDLAHGGLPLVTPNQHPEGAEGPGPGFYTPAVLDLVKDVWRQADEYWEGSRQQGELDL